MPAAALATYSQQGLEPAHGDGWRVCHKARHNSAIALHARQTTNCCSTTHCWAVVVALQDMADGADVSGQLLLKSTQPCFLALELQAVNQSEMSIKFWCCCCMCNWSYAVGVFKPAVSTANCCTAAPAPHSLLRQQSPVFWGICLETMLWMTHRRTRSHIAAHPRSIRLLSSKLACCCRTQRCSWRCLAALHVLKENL